MPRATSEPVLPHAAAQLLESGGSKTQRHWEQNAVPCFVSLKSALQLSCYLGLPQSGSLKPPADAPLIGS